MVTKTKIALIDIETAPSLGYVWGKWEQDVIDFEKGWYILSFAVRWFGEKKTTVYGLDDFKTYKKDKENDVELVKKLWEVFDNADVIIAHNGDEFDIKKANARFVSHGMTPPSSYKTVDTKKVAKKYFRFDSNKLDDLGNYLGVGRKVQTGGFQLWRDCMVGVKAAWRKMKEYNGNDVDLLLSIYLKLRPWMSNHPNLNIFSGTTASCPICNKGPLIRRGYGITLTGKRPRFQCKSCGGWSSGKIERTGVEVH